MILSELAINRTVFFFEMHVDQIIYVKNYHWDCMVTMHLYDMTYVLLLDLELTECLDTYIVLAQCVRAQ